MQMSVWAWFAYLGAASLFGVGTVRRDGRYICYIISAGLFIYAVLNTTF